MNVAMPVWTQISPTLFVDVEFELSSYDKDIDNLFYEWDRAEVELPGVDEHYWNTLHHLQMAQQSIVEGHCLAVAAGF